ncbi:Zn finger [Haloarcula tailed virus 2]|uniref:Zn finger n=1 Tax=Haloarcula tailed virus 2 TaxID=2877989 RepID=A0AAE8Y0N1_9CAUD|nr:Zn finger [Haloarcula tailed virus 2]UBF23241.1 Zn finger [Haloarcula tailed virus 2]
MQFNDTVFEKKPQTDAKDCWSCQRPDAILCKTESGDWLHRCTTCGTERGPYGEQ